MKKIAILLGLATSIIGFANENGENSIDLGLGVFYKNSLYKQKDNHEVLPVPFIGVQYKNFYYEAPIELGYHLYKTDKLTLTAYGRYNLYTGYKPKDMIKEFKDLDKRKDDFHLGLRNKYHFGPINTGFVAEISGDVSGKSDGLIVKAELNQPIMIKEKFMIMPYIAVEYMNDDYTDYYFGIKKSEASRGINGGKSHKVDDSFNLEAGVRGIVDINDSFKVLLNAEYKRYGSSISDSPIVKDRDIYTIGAGISYSFKF